MYRKVILSTLVVWLSCVQMGLATPVIVEWDPNTESDLAGYKIYYGKTPRTQGPYTETVVIQDRTATSRSIELSPDTYYFALTAFDTSGNESEYSPEVRAVVPASSLPGKPGRPVLMR